MKNIYNILFLFFLVVSNSLVAQITFKPSFYVDNSGTKIDCLIKDVDWKSNPTTFEFKLSENEIVQVAVIDNVQEFQVGEGVKYIRKTVEIDRWDKFSPPTAQKGPIFKTETLFLKTLVEGAATLYAYSENSFNTYFYSIDGKNPQQLIQKQYVINDGIKDIVYKNDLYKRQLESELLGDKVKTSKINNLSYFRSELIDVFQKYNGNNGQTEMASALKTKIHITPRIGLSSNQVDVSHLVYQNYAYDFGAKTNFRVGVEFESLLPFNRGKWAIALEPAYTSYKSDGDGSDYTDDIDYQSLELHLVARHYMFLKSNSKLFLNAGFLYSKDINDAVYSPSGRPTSVDIDLGFQIVLGAGYKYKKLSAEFRYIGNQSMISNHSTWNANYTSYSFILGYTIF